MAKRGDERWGAQVNLDHENGKRQRQYLYGATRAEVEAELARARAARRENRPIDATSATTSALLCRWLVEVARLTVRPKTHVSHAQALRIDLLPGLGDLPLGEHSAHTALYAQAVLCRARNHALARGQVRRNGAMRGDVLMARRLC